MRFVRGAANCVITGGKDILTGAAAGVVQGGKIANRNRGITAIAVGFIAAGFLGYHAYPCFNPQLVCQASCELVAESSGFFGFGGINHSAKLVESCPIATTICQRALSVVKTGIAIAAAAAGPVAYYRRGAAKPPAAPAPAAQVIQPGQQFFSVDDLEEDL